MIVVSIFYNTEHILRMDRKIIEGRTQKEKMRGRKKKKKTTKITQEYRLLYSVHLDMLRISCSVTTVAWSHAKWLHTHKSTLNRIHIEWP